MSKSATPKVSEGHTSTLATNTKSDSKPLWITHAQLLVEKARRDLIRKARARELYTLDKRAKVAEAGPQRARQVWGA